MRLAIKGFNNQIVSAEDVLRLLQVLPTQHIAGLQSIVYSSVQEFRSLGVNVPCSCIGAYYPDYRAVVIHRIESKQTFAHVLYHEIGHYVYSVVIGSYLKKQWCNSFCKSSQHVSPYAATNASEDFAECYAFYSQKNWSKFSSNPAKLAFIKKYVF